MQGYHAFNLEDSMSMRNTTMLAEYIETGQRPKAMARIGPPRLTDEPLPTLVPDSPNPAKRTTGHDKPAVRQLQATRGLDDFGLRVGTRKSLAAAMYARKCGATLAEVRAITGQTQFNVLRELEGKGYPLSRWRFKGVNGHWVTRYFLRYKP